MTFEIWISILMGILGVGITITATLLKILYSSLQARLDRLEENIELRLRTLVHEDRDIRTQLQGVTKLFFESLRGKKEK